MYQESKSPKETEFLPSLRAERAENAPKNAYALKFSKCSKSSDIYSPLIKIDF